MSNAVAVKRWGPPPAKPMDLCPRCKMSVRFRCPMCPWQHRTCASNHSWAPCPMHPERKVFCVESQVNADHFPTNMAMREANRVTCTCHYNDPNAPSAAFPEDLFGFRKLVPQAINGWLEQRRALEGTVPSMATVEEVEEIPPPRRRALMPPPDDDEPTLTRDEVKAMLQRVKKLEDLLEEKPKEKKKGKRK